jgi:hypothetical protein
MAKVKEILGIQFKLQRFILRQDNDGRVFAVPTISNMPENRQLENLQIGNIAFVNTVALNCNGVTKTDIIVNLGNNNDVIQIDVSKLETPELRSKYAKATYYMRGKGAAMKLYVLRKGLNPTTAAIEFKLRPLFGTEKPVKFHEAGMPGFCRFGGKNGGQIATNGSEKVGVLTLTNNNNADSIAKRDDTVSFGMLPYYYGKSMDIVVAAKLASRAANWMSVKLADQPETPEDSEIRCYGIYFGVFGGDSTDVFGTDPLDGMSFTTMCKPGAAVQNRAYLFKTVSHGVSDRQMKVLCDHLDRKPIHLTREQIASDKNLTAELHKAVQEKGEGTRFAGRLVIICDDVNSPVQYLGDMNALKADYDFTRISGLNIVKTFDNDKKDHASLSSQVLTKCLMNNVEKTTKLFVEQHKAELADKFDFKPIKATVESLTNQGTYINAMMDIDPDLQKKYGWLFRRLVNQTLLGDSNNISHMHVEVPGYYKLMAGDFGAFFGVKLLNADEIFCNGLKAVKSFSAIKFPAKNGLEYGNYRVVSYKTILERIAEKVALGLISKSVARCLAGMFQNLKTSIVVFPAFKIVKQLHAGADFDGDEVMLYETEFVGLTAAPVAVRVDNADQKGGNNDTVIFTPDIMAQMMARKLAFDNVSVGAITNALEALQYMEFEALRNAEKAQSICDFFAEKLLPVFVKFARQFGIKPDKDIDAYVPVLHIDGEDHGIKYIDVNWQKIAKTVSQIIAVSMNKDNILAFLHDWNSGIDRWFQETTIDSFKQFFNVNFPKGLIKVLKRSTDTYKTRIDWRKNEVVISEVADARGIRDEIRQAMRVDTIKLAESVKDKVAKMPSFTDEFSGADSSIKDVCMDMYEDVEQSVKDAMATLMYLIIDAGSIYANTLDSDLYASIIEGIQNQIRMVTYGMAPAARMAVVFGFLFNNKEIMDTVLPKLGTVILRDEMIAFVANASSRRDEVSDIVEDAIDCSFDPSLMVARIYGSPKFIDKVAALLHGKDDDTENTFQILRDEYNELKLFINGQKGGNLDVGKAKFNRLASILVNREGTIASTYRDRDDDENVKNRVDEIFFVFTDVKKIQKGADK